MNKVRIGIFLLGLLVILTGCSGKKSSVNEVNELNDSNNMTMVSNSEGKLDDISMVRPREKLIDQANKNLELIVKEKKSAKLLDEAFLLGSGDKSLVELYDNLGKQVENNILNKVPVEKILSSKNGKEYKLKFEVVDTDNNRPLAGVDVYVWGAYVGQTDESGKLVKKIKLSLPYKYLYIQAFKKGYSPVYLKKNALYDNGRLIYSYIMMKKIGKLYKVDNPSKEISIEDKKISIDITSTCSVVDKNGECVKSPVEFEVDYVNPTQRESLSIPTTALYNGKIVHLMSNGMAFIRIYDKSGNLLKLKDNINAKICYKVGKKAIEDREKSQKYSIQGSDGYWWFDKSKGVWRFDKDALITIDKEKGLFCFQTSHIY